MKHRSLALAVTLAVATSFAWQLTPASAAFPGGRGEIAFVHSANGVDEIRLFDPRTDPFGNFQVPIFSLTGRDIRQLAWSADGQKIAFSARTAPDAPFAIYTVDADGTSLVQVTSGSLGDGNPAWSPDGSQIAFDRLLSGGTQAIYITASDGTGAPTPFTDGSLDERQPSWSPDGAKLAYTAFDVPPSFCPECKHVVETRAIAGGHPSSLTSLTFEATDPDWAPDGSQIAYTLNTTQPDGSPGSVVLSVSTTGGIAPQPGIIGSSSHASWSPDGRAMVYETVSGTFHGLVVWDAHRTPWMVTGAVGDGHDPAWGPGTATPPEITYTVNPNANGWFGIYSFISVTATDPDGVDPIITCTMGGVPAGPLVYSGDRFSLTGTIPLTQPGVDVPIVCSATDVFGATGEASTSVNLDTGIPLATGLVLSPTTIASSASSLATASASDDLSGVAGGALYPTGLFGGLGQVFPMDVSATGLAGWVGPGLAPDIYRVEAQPIDRAGNLGSGPAGLYLVVYDPAAGSTSGSGWIVPGGPTSDFPDQLPGLDGQTKASFAFSAKYKTATSSTPTGNFNLSYGSSFKLQSRTLSWLIVRETNVALLEGTATIKGMAGTFTFRASLRDGGPTGPDHLQLRVWPSGADPNTATATYQASGDAGGQIQIVH